MLHTHMYSGVALPLLPLVGNKRTTVSRMLCQKRDLMSPAPGLLSWGDENGTHELFLSQTFRAPPGYPGKIPGYPAKKFGFLGFGRTCRTFWPPTPSRGRPPPHSKISGPKSSGLGSLFFPESSANTISKLNHWQWFRFGTQTITYRLAGTHWAFSQQLSEGPKTHWVRRSKPYSPRQYSSTLARLHCSASSLSLLKHHLCSRLLRSYNWPCRTSSWSFSLKFLQFCCAGSWEFWAEVFAEVFFSECPSKTSPKASWKTSRKTSAKTSAWTPPPPPKRKLRPKLRSAETLR